MTLTLEKQEHRRCYARSANGHFSPSLRISCQSRNLLLEERQLAIKRLPVFGACQVAVVPNSTEGWLRADGSRRAISSTNLPRLTCRKGSARR